MKNQIFIRISLFILCVIGLYSCKKNNGFNDIVSTDTTKPGVVTNVQVTDYDGGSYITYTLPNTTNTLYVLAKYQIRNGVSRETKASYFSDTVNVEGFAKAQEYQVTLYTVSRANVMSDPVTVKVHPKTPVYQLVRSTSVITPDFGGLNVSAQNPDKKEIGVIITAFNKSTNAMEVEDQHYTNEATINYSLRGYDTTGRDFGVYITDKFGNISDTLKKKVSPLFEQLLDKSKFSIYNLASDSPIGYGWSLSNLWDGHTDDSTIGWHTDPSGPPPPYVGTFNVGLSYKLSRFIIWERPDGYAFGAGNPKVFTLWGSNVAAPKDAKLPLSSAVGTVVGDWINLGNYTYPNPPSGMPTGSTTASDNAFVKAGVNFNIPLTAPPVHFIRVAVALTWSGGSYTHFMEISLYGKQQ